MLRTSRWPMVALLLAAGLLLSACATPAASPTKPKPATTETVAGSTLKRVILTEEAARRIDLRTEPIRLEGGARVMPYSAIVYDKSGSTWAYTPTEQPLTFVRERIDVGSVLGKLAYLDGGPAPGTQVVTVGMAELFGVEYGFMK
jgi:hypothetical protein